MSYSQFSNPSDIIRLVVVDRDHDTLVKTSKALMATQRVDIASETTTYSIACSIIERHQPEFVVIGVDEEKIHTVEKIRTRFPGIKIISIGDGDNSELILKCFRSGADEFLQRPLYAEELQPVFDRLKSRKQAEITEVKNSGRVVAFLGSSGGCGVSTVALNFAHQLAQTNDTILIDFHFGQGDLSVHCNMQPAFSLRDLSETEEPMDQALIDSITQQLGEGLRVIFQPYDCQPYLFHYEHIQALLNQLKQRYSYVVLDMGGDVERSLDCLDLVDEWFLVLKQDLSAVFMASRKLQRFMQADVEAQSIKLIVNAYGKNNAISMARIAKALHRKDLNFIRNDEKTVLSAVNQGQPLHQISRWSKAFKDLKKIVDQWKKNEPTEPVSTANESSDELPSIVQTQYAGKALS